MAVAILAYGTTQTHLLFSGLPPACQSASCLSTAPGGGNGVPLKTSAKPVTGGEHGAASGAQERRPGGPVTTSPSPTTNPAAGGQPQPQGPAPQPPSATGPAGPKVAVVYHTLRNLPGGFLASITIWNRGESALAGWQLWMQYQQARVDYARGAHWFPADPLSRAGLAAPATGQRPLRPGTGVRFILHVTGSAGPPAGCAFEGYRCKFSGQRG